MGTAVPCLGECHDVIEQAARCRSQQRMGTIEGHTLLPLGPALSSPPHRVPQQDGSSSVEVLSLIGLGALHRKRRSARAALNRCDRVGAPQVDDVGFIDALAPQPTPHAH